MTQAAVLLDAVIEDLDQDSLLDYLEVFDDPDHLVPCTSGSCGSSCSNCSTAYEC